MADSAITLEMLAERIAGLDRLLIVQFNAYQTAIKTAFDSNNERLEVMNNFREDYNRLVRTLLTKTEFNDKYAVLEKQDDKNEERLQKLELVKADLSGRIWMLGVVIGALVIALKYIKWP